jgi:hypothetical protein
LRARPQAGLPNKENVYSFLLRAMNLLREIPAKTPSKVVSTIYGDGFNQTSTAKVEVANCMQYEHSD